MFSRTCDGCSATFALEDARVDPVTDQCGCPHCGTPQPLNADAVDFAKHMKLRNVAPFLGALAICAGAAALDALQYVGPILVFAYGAYLARSSALRDHRIVGVVVCAAAVVVFAGAMYVG
jgi:hypothetical protein